MSDSRPDSSSTKPDSRSGETTRRPPHRVLLMLSLVLAGESIYMLPYLRKSFQTSMEAVFELSSLQVGTLNALFGLLALLCYLPGGWLADRVSARRLLAVSLVAAGLGGLYMASLPSYAGLLVVHAFWGIFTILTFWAALIKATRLWSKPTAQGRAFGILDGGRGLVGAALGSLAALCFGLSESVESGLIAVIVLYSASCLIAAGIVWWVVPDDHATFHAHSGSPTRTPAVRALTQTLGMPAVWWIAVVIFCAYFSFLGTYEFPAFVERGYAQSKEFGAWLGAWRDWMRPAAAIGAGVIADRISASRATGATFLILAVSYLSLTFIPTGQAALIIAIAQMTAAALAVFALRGIYFALFEEARIPLASTGIAVGFVSMVGYTPDIIAPLSAGWLADQFQGAQGYRIYFGVLSMLAAIGAFAALRIRKTVTSRAIAAAEA